jgi:hypothetical protein
VRLIGVNFLLQSRAAHTNFTATRFVMGTTIFLHDLFVKRYFEKVWHRKKPPISERLSGGTETARMALAYHASQGIG